MPLLVRLTLRDDLRVNTQSGVIHEDAPVHLSNIDLDDCQADGKHKIRDTQNLKWS